MPHSQTVSEFFTASDTGGSHPLAIVDQAFAGGRQVFSKFALTII
jgi:hypothetical protein